MTVNLSAVLAGAENYAVTSIAAMIDPASVAAASANSSSAHHGHRDRLAGVALSSFGGSGIPAIIPGSPAVQWRP